MDNTFTKKLFFLAIFTLFIITGVFAQTITVGTVDPGPYGQGSSIAVPINVNTSGGCVNSGNTYNVYLSDASGNFTPGTLIGSYTGVYATFVNGVIPNGTPAGAGYKVEVKSTNPAVTSTVSAAFSISGNPGVTASLTTSETVSAGVFGRCVGSTAAYSFTSSAGGTVTASFFNESTQAYESSNVSIPGNFTPATTNYTVTGKSVNGSGTVGTFDYQLVNNVVVNPFSPFGTPFVCIPAGGTGDLQFIMPITGPGGIINNYPGTTYTVNWGDGTSTTFTYCQIVALGGILIHTYTLPSCGQTSTGGATNSLTVVSHAVSPYCGEVASAATTSAKVIITPITSFAAPTVACVGTALTIPNTSDPGPDYSTGAASTCAVNANAKYDWTLDGVAVAGYQGVPLSKSFIFPATTTHGNHTLTLHAETPAIGCASTDYTQIICFEDPPQPVFTMPTPLCVTGGPVSPTNTSIVDNTCAVPQYIWTVTGPGTVTYAGGTSANSAIPQFVFPVPGFYTVKLGISSSGCGVINAAPQTIAVDAAPTTSMSPDATICGSNLTFTFDPSQTITKTVVSGTTLPTPTTFSWVITGGAYSFLGGTSATSQYPQILFADYATYTIQVTNTNSCGSSTASQTLTFVQAPTVSAGPDQPVCASNPATTLAATVTGSYTSYQWVGGTGAFAPDRNTINAVYTPSASEITAGTVTLTFQVNTALPSPCNKVTDNMKITITPTAFITSPPTASVCSGQALSYIITANNALATFTWTASVTSGTATGFTASGSGPNITDVLTNSGTTDAVVAYDILPTINSCPGTPFTLNVAVHPLPSITAAPVLSPICNNQPANILLNSNVSGTSYTWTSAAGAGITGNTNQATALVTSSIQDILVNSGTTPASVTYTVTPYNGTCPGTPVVTSITVEPSAVISNAGPDQELCNTTSATLNANNPSPQTGLWTQTSGPAGPAFSANNDPHATVTGLVPGNVYQFQWAITGSASCPPSTSTVNITIDNPPVGGTATANPTQVCAGSGSTITLAGQSGTIVEWQSSTDGTNWTSIVNTTATLTIPSLTQTTQYRALIHNGASCPDTYSTIATVTVDQPPTVSVAGPADEVCNATAYTLQGNTPTVGTDKWTQVSGPAGAAFVNDTNPTTTVTGLVPGTYQFQWTITATATCPASSSTVTIINDTPPFGGTATPVPSEVCLGSNSVITLTGQTGSIVEWESSTDGVNWISISNTTTTLTTPALTQTTQYRAKLHTTAICSDVYSTVATVTVDQPPTTAVAGAPDEICNTTVYTLQGNTPTVGTGQWTQIAGPAGAVFTNDANPNTTVTGLLVGSIYQFQWTITAAATCPVSSSTVTITVDAPPVGGTATPNPSEVCLGSGSVITLAGQSGTILEWQSSTDGITWSSINNNTTTLTIPSLTQTTQYRAKLHTTAICADVYSTIATVTVDLPPTASIAGPSDEVCNAITYTLQGNTPAVGTGKWTQVSGPAGASFVNDTNPTTAVNGLVPGTYQFQWTITAAATCPASSSLVTIIIDSPPVGGTATATPSEVCLGSNSVITLAGQLGSVVQWESSTDGFNWTLINNTTTTLTTTALTQTTQYRAKLHNTITCPDVYSTIAIVTVDTPPTIAVAGPPDEICNTSIYTLQGNTPTVGVGKWTQIAGPAGATFTNDANPHTTVTGLLAGNTYQFQWTITAAVTCPSSSSTVTIKVDNPPVGGTATPNPAEVCLGSGSVITLAGQSGTILEWQSSTDGGVNWLSINNTTTTLSIASLTQTTQYRAKLHTTAVCFDAYSTIATVIVDQPPTASVAGPPDEVCNTTVYTLQGNTPTVGAGKWTQLSGPAGASFINDTYANTTVTGLVPGTYQFQWTITASANCPASTSTVTIKVDTPPVGGIATANPTEVCLGSNSVITLTGQTGNIIQWESSKDGINWVTINNTTATLNTPALTQTTQYRAKLHTTTVCPDVYSTIATVTVDQPPTTAVAGPPDEICNTTAYTLQGNTPTVGAGKWTQVSGPPGLTFTNDANPNTTVNGLVPGTYIFQWTITATASCPVSSSTVTIKVDSPPLGGTATPTPAEVCLGSGSQITLAGYFGTIVEWESSADGVFWQTIPNSGNNPILQIASLTQTTQYRAKLHTNIICQDVYSTVATVTVDQPPIAANAGPNTEICNSTNYKLQGNNPSPGTGKWTVIIGSGVTFDNDTDPTAIVSGLIPGNSYQFRWTITNSPVCPSTTADVTIKDDLPPVGGTTSNPATVCSGDNVGQVFLSGYAGNVKEWQSSVDNGATWQTINNAGTTTTLNYAQLTQTTQFRAGVINSGVCDEVFSTPVTITVNPVTPIADAGPNHDICNETVITMNANNPAPFAGMWTQTAGPAVTIVNPNLYNTQVLGLSKGNSYTFKWIITGIAPCPNTESSITINSFEDVIPSFTMDKNTNCGALTVNFTNTSTPSPVGTFVWDFGDGTPTITAINPPPHVFAPSPSGAPITYTIKMTPISNCGSKTPYTDQVTISPSTPVAALVPNQSNACGTFTLTAKNLSPGDNAQYDFYLKDANGNIVQHLTFPDKRDAVFQQIIPTVPADYTVYVVATDKCGNQGTSPVQIISVSPSTIVSQVQIKGDVNSVCLGSPVTFQNISTGGDRFTITVYDANKNVILTLPAGTSDMNYTPTAVGTYYVSITAGNDGCGDAPVSALKQFTVSPTPNPSFTYAADQNFNVTFNNTTPGLDGIPASSITYKWDFGDGSSFDSSYIPSTHHFDVSRQPFTVTLTATTPGTECSAITQQTINIKFQGNLFLPNAFIPASSNKNLNTFIAKGFGLKTWRMQIFNNFGQLVWETTKLDNDGAPLEGWDGTYKGRIVEQGVYIWQITATLLNGEEWKGMSYHNSAPSKTGAIHLIR